MIRYQGESIDFSIEIDRKDITWKDFTKVVIYFYTHTSRIAKFLYENNTAATTSEDDAISTVSEAVADSDTEAESDTTQAKAVASSTTSDYIVLTQDYNRFIKGTIPAEYTKTMSGVLLLDIMAYNGSSEQYQIKASQTDITIHYSPIKQEL